MAVAKQEKPKHTLIKPKTKEMEALLQAGYQMTIEEAKEIITLREKDPSLYPYDVYQQAKAMIEAYDAKPRAISKTPGWVRKPKPVRP